jgi:hypothetical protein
VALIAFLLVLAVPPDTIPEPSLWNRLGAGFTIGTGFEVPFTPSDPDQFGGGRTGAAGTNAAWRLTMGAHVFHRFGASITFSRYIVPRLQAPWDPDFVYSIGYDGTWPHGFAIGYANYDANRLSPAAGQPATRVERGVMTAAVVPPLPQWLRHPARAIDIIHPRVTYDLVPSYYDNRSGLYESGKHRVGAGVHVRALGGLFVSAVAHVYPDPSRQQPWDPDYTYVFGYTRGWPENLTIQYANYSGTRYPWREPVAGTGRFGNGSVSLSWSRRF